MKNVRTFQGLPLIPRVAELAVAVGGRVYSRNKTLWLAPWDKQLTYTQDNRVSPPRTLTPEDNLALAVEILEGILAARKQPEWGSPAERAKRILDGLEKTEYIYGNYCYFRHQSMDHACMMKSRDWSVWLHLVGVPTMEVRKDTFEECMAEMRKLAAIL